jgi:tRNA/rRNA methyltransferase
LKRRRVAGTDSRRFQTYSSGPAVILVEPQLGENIGMVARAMLNCGLTDLRLVRPREPWPNTKAIAAAAGADAVIASARLHGTTADAVADLVCVYAATARSRDMTKRTVTPRQAAAELRDALRQETAGGVLFGKEAKGLHNDDVAIADTILTVPLNPGFQSLNLAMAVLLVGYEWYLSAAKGVALRSTMPKDTRPATKAELHGLQEHLERELDACGFLRVQEKRPIMVRNLRNLFGRAGLSEQEVRTLHGVIACLASGRRS